MNNFSRLDLEKRYRFLQNELKFIRFKSIYHDTSLPKEIRIEAQLRLTKLKHYTKNKIRNRCVISSRGKAIYNKLGISRILLRDLSHKGLVIGLSKATW